MHTYLRLNFEVKIWLALVKVVEIDLSDKKGFGEDDKTEMTVQSQFKNGMTTRPQVKPENIWLIEANLKYPTEVLGFHLSLRFFVCDLC